MTVICGSLLSFPFCLHFPNLLIPCCVSEAVPFPCQFVQGQTLPCLIALTPTCRKFSVFADVLAACIFKYWLTMPPLHTWAILQYTSQTCLPVMTYRCGTVPVWSVHAAPGLFWSLRAQRAGLPSQCPAPGFSTAVQPAKGPVLWLWQK